jgi:hypothetical protein
MVRQNSYYFSCIVLQEYSSKNAEYFKNLKIKAIRFLDFLREFCYFDKS